MMTSKKKILLISHVEEVRGFIAAILRSKRLYEVLTAEDGTTGMERAIREKPNLIIVDIMTPNIEGYQLTKMLHSNVEQEIPILMILTKSPPPNFVKTLEKETNSFLPSSFDPMSLLDRVEAMMHRNGSSLLLNPLLRLPGNIGIGRELMIRPPHHIKFAVGYAELNDLKAYNDCYGSTRGDQIIIHTRRIVENAVQRFGTPHDTMRHISGNDFVFITIPERVDLICRNMIDTFEREILESYDEDSCVKGDEAPHASPLMTLSVAVVTNLEREFTDFTEIGEMAFGIQKYLRTLPGNHYAIDRRVTR